MLVASSNFFNNASCTIFTAIVHDDDLEVRHPCFQCIGPEYMVSNHSVQNTCYAPNNTIIAQNTYNIDDGKAENLTSGNSLIMLKRPILVETKTVKRS